MIRTGRGLHLVLLTCVDAAAAQSAPPTDHARPDAAALLRVESLYEAFDVKPGDKLYVEPARRVRIW